MKPYRILAGLDHTDLAEKVFHQALAIAQDRQEPELRLIHCLNLDVHEQLGSLLDAGVGLQSRLNLDESQQSEQVKHLQQTRTWLRQLCEQAARVDVMCDYRLDRRSPGPLLTYLAQEWSADLVVVGNGKKEVWQTLILGSVSKYVIQHSPCPTLVVPSGNQKQQQFPPQADIPPTYS
ncbi:universal stress protein [Phormidium yuhuli AB48]|uniref:Universal stress protein n=1 Tax=Phormidium yuhuli AB48 TaxID=2940671 RepID=A0ABY5ASE7_9CYAN|nr:universal stress protein [Phormidium yuhuli]USR91778.1 universal stress protein [Phormidium yuhuli AB48]